jgi:hypothetical protein
VQRVLAAERDVAEQVVGAVGAERLHEAAGPDVAVRARQRVAVEVAGATGQRQRAVDDPRGGPLTNALAACASANSATSGSSDSSTSAAARASVARQAPSSIAFSATSVRARASGTRTAACEVATAASAMPSEAEAWKRPATRLRSMYASASPARNPPRSADSGTSTPEKVTELLPEARMPSASQSSWMRTPSVAGSIAA